MATSAFSSASDISCRLPPPPATLAAWLSASSWILSTDSMAWPRVSANDTPPAAGRARSAAPDSRPSMPLMCACRLWMVSTLIGGYSSAGNVEAALGHGLQGLDRGGVGLVAARRRHEIDHLV